MKKQALLIAIAALLGSQIHAEYAGKKPVSVRTQVEQALKPVLSELDPIPQFKHNNRNELTVKYRTRSFMVHSGAKSRRWSEKAHEVVGPDYDGFMLWIFVGNTGTGSQVMRPSTSERPYWKTEFHRTFVTGTSKQIKWNLSYGSRPNERILSKIRKALRELDNSVRIELPTHTDAEQTRSKSVSSNLTGVLRINKDAKAISPYQLNIDGGGQIYLRADILKNISEGTRLWAIGTIRSTPCYDISNPKRTTPIRYDIFMDVHTCYLTSKPFERPIFR